MLVSPDLPFLVKPHLVISLSGLLRNPSPLHSFRFGAGTQGAVPGILSRNSTTTLFSPFILCDTSTLYWFYNSSKNGTTEWQHLFISSFNKESSGKLTLTWMSPGKRKLGGERGTRALSHSLYFQVVKRNTLCLCKPTLNSWGAKWVGNGLHF